MRNYFKKAYGKYLITITCLTVIYFYSVLQDNCDNYKSWSNRNYNNSCCSHLQSSVNFSIGSRLAEKWRGGMRAGKYIRMHSWLPQINKNLMRAWHRTACWTYAARMAKPSGSESSIPTNCSLMLPYRGKALFPRHWGHKWRNIIEMIICIKTQIWADILLALCNPRGCLGEGGEGVCQ